MAKHVTIIILSKILLLSADDDDRKIEKIEKKIHFQMMILYRMLEYCDNVNKNKDDI